MPAGKSTERPPSGSMSWHSIASVLMLLPLGVSTGLTRDHFVKASSAIRPLSSCHSASTPWCYGYLGFACSGAADQNQVARRLQRRAGVPLAHQRLVHRALSEVESGQI